MGKRLLIAGEQLGQPVEDLGLPPGHEIGLDPGDALRRFSRPEIGKWTCRLEATAELMILRRDEVVAIDDVLEEEFPQEEEE